MAYLFTTLPQTVSPKHLPDKYGITDTQSHYGTVYSPPTKPLRGEQTLTNYPLEFANWLNGKYLNEASFATLYYRLLSSRSTFNFGVITGERTETFTIWNGYTQSIALTKIDNLGVSGVDVIPANGVTPINIAPYRSIALRVVVRSQGDASIRGQFRLSFSNGDSVYINVNGSRLVLLNIKPNWNDRFVEIFQYKTDILTSRNLYEQRRSLLAQPRRTISYNALIQHEELSKLRNTLHRWQNKVFILPLWQQRTNLVSGGHIGSDEIEVEDIGFEFVEGNNLCLWLDFNRNEIFEIVSINGNKLKLNTQLSIDFSNNAAVYPAVTVRMNENLSFDNYTDAVSDMGFVLSCDPTSGMAKMPVADADARYNGVEVLERKPNWATPLGDEYETVNEMVDYGYGKIDWFSRDVPSLIIRSATYLAKNFSDIMWWKAFIQRQLGALRSFYLPSGTNDLTLINYYVSGSVEFDVRDDALTTILGKSKDRKHLRIATKDGVYYTSIDSVVAHNGFARITLSKTIPRNLTPTDVKSIQFLLRCRIASDEIEFEYLTRNTAQLSLTFKQIRETP